jgi:hypothetical protein
MIGLLFSVLALAADPPPFPVFLKAGFSSVLEFDEAPSRVVLGDGQKFQVEKMEHSLVVRTLAPFASTNLFVYFEKRAPRLFLLTASEDAQPTFYKSFVTPPPLPKPVVQAESSKSNISRGGKVISLRFDAKKDYLTIDFWLRAGSDTVLRPKWKLSRLQFAGSVIAPLKLWAERKEVQKSSQVRARLIFAKPNVPRNLSAAILLVPLEGGLDPVHISLKGAK